MSLRLAPWLALWLALPVLLPHRAFAEGSTQRTAFAVVVGNNRSLQSRRPDLHYADDDAARYFEILRTIAPDRTVLLADFDRDTEQLFPAARPNAKPPTRAELLRAGRELADRVRAASATGAETELYFVFAGHGDVDAGSGFIELADARFTAADLEQWLRAIPFSRAHVILDSCNSFFMLGVRKPGGRYFATPEDAARSLSLRLPNVGVFLSTSAEGEAFEWSEVQSGIFSHVVRSGLLGAADADGDGAVSYLELAAFVATATADIRNPNMRPHVFARGPGARNDLPIVTAAGRTGIRRLRLGDAGPLRVRLRDREGMVILDAYAEAGASFEVPLPQAWAAGAVLERSASPRDGSTKPRSYAIPDATGPVELAMLTPLDEGRSARGPAEVFQNMFGRPYGPGALAAYEVETRDGGPRIFGVSRADAARMNLLLGEIESAERSDRILSGAIYLGTGAVLVAAGASGLAFDRNLPEMSKKEADTEGGLYLGLGALSLGYGIYTLSRPWSGERAAADYRAALGAGEDYANAFAAADQRLAELAKSETRSRWMRGVAGSLLVAGSAAWIVGSELSSPSADQRISVRIVGGAGVVVGGTMLATALIIDSPIERLTTVWRRDPGMLQFQPILAATRGGALLGAAGRF